jgi:hypothetical protein
VSEQYRQGDVLIERIDAIPPAAVPAMHPGRWILAEGEVTGHIHSVAAEDATLLLLELDDEIEVYLRVHTKTEVTHQEHGPITLAPGDYRVGRQREYSPGQIRRVAD